MRGGIASALAASVVLAGAVALAGPAHADQYDFIAELDNAGVWYADMFDMIDIGKELCHELRHGVSPPLVLGKLGNTGFAPAESAIVLMSAVNHLCLDAKPVVVGWARDQGYVGPL